ncbi:hypothetical protein [Falsirhodobacter sp. 20TX0035]|uniref:hypothetical protein n=1 Tax=Falsirhodobacter sp. 20TX0035 TaxID=3022019 RepID=UPI00232B7060|nr:hypothetical protein [Falsirhodobacter sp. 20TX0035]MDB6454414.1 hypothetical protein [Falsirhodobacter sp. 20TX0035]
MSSKIVLVGLIALAGCNAPARDPLPYSPNYHYIGGAPAGVIRKGYDAPQGRLVPDACTTPDVAADPMYLPPGCANAVNLQQMVVNQSDLVRGRTPGPAMGAPAARAARQVIDGTEPPPAASEDEVLSTTRILR